MATETQTKLVGFGYGNKANYSATTYANHIWFDPTNKQILLNGIEYIPKKLSELVNDSGFLTSITKSMVENVLTGNITSHTHSYIPLADKGLSNGKVSYYVNFPSFTQLVSLGYNEEYTKTDDEYYFKGLCKWAIDNYANQGEILLIGNARPNGVGYCCIQLYSNSGKDADTGLPRYCSGTYRSLTAITRNFHCYEYRWTWKGTFEGNAETASKWANARTITLTGSVTGSVSIDGSANVSLATTTNHTHTFASITSKPTTLSGYGITDAALASDLSKYLPLTGGTLSGDITFSAANKNIGTSSVPLSALWANSVFSSTTLLIGAGTSVMTFDKDGNVAIGKSSVSKYKLDVSGSIYSMSGGITSADGFIKLNSSDSYILLGGGGTKAVSDFATSAVATASANGLMSAAMFKAEMVKSVSVRQGSADVIVGGSITNHSVYITQKKSNITDAYQHAIGANDVKIPNATKDYDGSMSYTDKKKLDGISNYAPKKVVMLQVTFNSNGTVTINKGGGDFDITKDAEIMGSEYVEETSANGHYAIGLSFDTATSSNPLRNWFNNYFVKFSFMSKSTRGTSDFFVNLNSNFDGDTLNIQCISTKTKYTDTFDCIWEFY